jgi:hypothetical protein
MMPLQNIFASRLQPSIHMGGQTLQAQPATQAQPQPGTMQPGMPQSGAILGARQMVPQQPMQQPPMQQPQQAPPVPWQNNLRARLGMMQAF